MKRFYEWLLYLLDMGERRCMTCKKLLGYKRHLRPRGCGTTGLCRRCVTAFLTPKETTQ